jgi:hypothetical protein
MIIPAKKMVVLETYDRHTHLKPHNREVRAQVQWDGNTEGRRFFHVRHDPVPPTISELIEAADLHSISDGVQKMSGVTTVEGPAVLEVWTSVSCAVISWKLEVL